MQHGEHSSLSQRTRRLDGTGGVVLRASRRVFSSGHFRLLPSELLVGDAELPDDVLLERVQADAGGEENLDPEPVRVLRRNIEALVHAEHDVREIVQVTNAAQCLQPVRYEARRVRLGERLADVCLDWAGVGRGHVLTRHPRILHHLQVTVLEHVEQRVDVRF